MCVVAGFKEGKIYISVRAITGTEKKTVLNFLYYSPKLAFVAMPKAQILLFALILYFMTILLQGSDIILCQDYKKFGILLGKELNEHDRQHFFQPGAVRQLLQGRNLMFGI